MPLKYPNYLFNPRDNRSLKINNVQIIIGAGPGDKYIPPENGSVVVTLKENDWQFNINP